jgi:hypothetical protein
MCRDGGARSNATDSRSVGLGLREFKKELNTSPSLHVINKGVKNGKSKEKN